MDICYACEKKGVGFIRRACKHCDDSQMWTACKMHLASFSEGCESLSDESVTCRKCKSQNKYNEYWFTIKSTPA